MSAVLNAVTRWVNPATRPLFKGNLYDPGTGCMCAQGDVLHNEGGYSAQDLINMEQSKADRLAAALLGISLAHSILLRNVNDKSDGQPQNVLTDPSSVLGANAHQVLSLWLVFDKLDREGWDSVYKRVYSADAADDAAYADAAYAYADAAYAAYAAAYAADAADDAYKWRVSPYTLIRGATMEIIGQAKLREQGKPFRLLPLFGFDTPEAIPALYVPPVLDGPMAPTQ